MIADWRGFAPYGQVLRSGQPENTQLFCSPGPVGWKLAELPVTEREVLCMSLHDNTPEAFIPLEGAVLLKVATRADFGDCKTFLLDRPALIRAGVWHGLAAPAGPARLLLVENETVHLVQKPIAKGVGE